MTTKRGEVEIIAGDQKVVLKTGINAMARYQDISGETFQNALFAIGGENGETLDVVRLRRLFLVSVKSPTDMSDDEIGDFIDEIGMAVAAEKLGEAVQLAFPDAKPAETGGSAGNARKPRKRKTATR